MEKPSDSISTIAVLIPARRNEPALAPLIVALFDAGFGAIVLVDDGSPSEDRGALDELSRRERVHLLRHAANLGKGRALKTGFNYFLNSLGGFTGLVTADADGQHAANDIVRVAQMLLASPGCAVLGCRNFGTGTPFRSRFGNALTRMVFHFVSGCKVSDTQSGLRAFPASLLKEIVVLPGERYEYEMTVLAYLCGHGRQPLETPISTIYIDRNRGSAFNPVRDSMRIYFVLLRYCTASLLSAALDFAVFGVVYTLTHGLLLSIAAGRLSSLANFTLNRSFVFRCGGRVGMALARYYLLAVLVAMVSYGCIREILTYWGWNVYLAKLVVESLLSVVTFSIQTLFVFPVQERE